MKHINEYLEEIRDNTGLAEYEDWAASGEPPIDLPDSTITPATPATPSTQQPSREVNTQTKALESRVKIEPPERLRNSLVIQFEALLQITKQHTNAGAIQLELLTSEGQMVLVWIPKKLCSNLDMSYNTVGVWDVFWKEKMQELEISLPYTPMYYREYMKSTDEYDQV